MSAFPAAEFELEGEFIGFFKDVFGKRRMVLRANDTEVFLKVPKDLRRQLDDRLNRGEQILVKGYVDTMDSGRERRVVSEVQAGESVCLRCPIRICVKKNCWRQGGKELWHALERGIAELGLEDSVQLEGVDCLGHCKRAPNAEFAGKEFHHCTPRTATEILGAFTGDGAKKNQSRHSASD